MSGTTVEMDRYVDRWWLMFAAALFLLIPLDLLTTYVAISRHGTAVEANPIMRWLFEQGLLTVTVVNLIAVAFAVSMFHGALTQIRRAPERSHRALAYLVNVWVGVLLLAGVALIFNNLLVII